MKSFDKKGFLNKVGQTCVSCGKEVCESNMRLYKRGSENVDNNWENFDPMCKECFDNIETGKADRKKREEIQRIMLMIEDDKIELDNNSFSIEILKIIAND